MAAFTTVIKHASQQLFNMVFPPRCLLCHAFIPDVGALCGECWKLLDFNSEPACAICSYPFEYDMGEGALCGKCIAHPPPYQRAYAVFRYNSVSKNLIYRFKYNDQLHAAPHFARWMARAGKKALESADMLVPVPLHRYRLLRRHYNQAAVLALEIGKIYPIPVHTQLLIRSKHTPSQATLSSSNKRLKNMQGAFQLHPRAGSIAGKHIILIDDVITTGATLIACSKLLVRAGATVTVLTLAQTIKEL